MTLELVVEGGEHDTALLNTVGNELLVSLQHDGYNMRPATYSGKKGPGDFVVELVPVAQHIVMTVWNHHAAIAEGIADSSGLATLFTSVLPVLKRVRQAHEKCVGKEESMAHPIKMTIDIDGKPLVIEASDIIQADAALQLAMKYCAAYPDTSHQETTKRKVKIQGRVPARKRRSRR